MQTPQQPSSDEAQIHALVEDIAKACRAKDSGAIVAHCAPEIIAFEVVDPIQYTGSAQVAKRMQDWFDSWKSDILYEVVDLAVAAGTETAFCHSLNHVDGIKTDGQRVDMWWRETMGFRKLDGRWRVTHLHTSVSFNPETGKASLDLKPG